MGSWEENPMDYLASGNGLIWWYEEATEEITYDYEDCLGG